MMSFFKRLIPIPKRPIAIFARYCHYSDVSAHKARPRGFDREKCFVNLLQTISQESRVKLTLLLDTASPMEGTHFIHKQNRYPIITSKQGSEGASFLWMMDVALESVKDEETIIYFLEDDYWHLPGWVNILREGFTLPKGDYVTLYDHGDKYILPQYQGLTSEIFSTPSCHWRTTPSTTNTYAMLSRTLTRDEQLQRQFSLGYRISKDHEKFCALANQGALLVSSIPGFSCHLEPDYVSPCTNWEKLLELNPLQYSSFTEKGGIYDQQFLS